MAEQLTITITAKDGASQVFKAVAQSAGQMGQSLDKAGTAGQGLDGLLKQIDGLDQEFTRAGTAITAFGAVVTGAAAVGVHQFASLEAAMANVATIAGQSDAWIANLTTQIRALAVELGTSPTGLAEGLYDLIGSGIDSADALDVLRTSAIAAKAGLTDTGTAAKAITAVLNAYKKSADEAGNVSDVLFKVVDSGVITFEELSDSLGRTLPIASLMKVSIEELGAAYAELTRQGVSASEAETGIAALLTAAINPTEALTRALEEYGYTSAEAMIATEGFTGFLQFLWDVSGGTASGMTELTGNVRANNAALILASDGASGYTDRLTEMNAAAQDGAYTQEVFATQMDTLNASLSRARAAWNDLAITLGANVAPAIDAGANAATGWATVISSLPDGLQTVASAAITAAGGVALITGGMLIAIPKVAETIAALSALKTALGAGTVAAAGFATALASVATAGGVAGLFIGAGIGGFIGEFIGSLRDGEGATKAFSDSVNVLQAALGKLRDGDVVGFFSTLANGIDNAAGSMKAFNTTIGSLWDEAARQQLLGNDAVAEGMQQLVAETSSMIKIADEYVGSAEFQARAMQEVVLAGVTQEQAIANLTAAYTQSEAELALYNEAVAALGRAFLDPSVNAEQLNAELDALATQFYRHEITLDQYREGLVDLAREYGDLPDDVQSTTDALNDQKSALDDITDATDRANQSWRDWQEGMGPFDPGAKVETVEWDDFVAQFEEDQEALKQKWKELNAEFASGALALGGWDNALSQLNLTGLTGELGLFAEEGIRAGQAFDNTFRILVTNVQQYGQGIQQATDWMEDLVTVNDEGWSKIGQLVTDNRITWEQGEAAVAAYNQTLEANTDIQQNLLAVQAMQAPYIAESVAATQAWVAELAQMEPHVQRTALAFADLQTVQQAQEIITLGNSAAFDQMGESGRAAFEQTIQGALQVNPLLFNVLETMGIISGTPLDFEVNYDALESAGSAIEQLTTQVGYLVDTLRQIYGLPPLNIEGEVDIDTSGLEGARSEVDLFTSMVQGLDAYRATPSIDVDGDGAYTDVDNIVTRLADIDGTTATATVNVIAGSAAVGDGTGGASNWRDMLDIPETVETSVTVTTTGVEDVTAASEAIAGLEDTSVTVSVDVNSTAVGDLMELIGTINDVGAATLTVDVVIGTNELDTGLTQFGIGTGGGGGAAGYTAPSVTVNVDANTSQAQMKIDFLGSGEDGSRAPITIMVDADTSAAVAQLEAVAGAAAAAAALGVSIPVDTPGWDAGVGQLGAVAGAAAAADALSVSVPVATPGSGEGIGQLQGVAGAAAAADAMAVSIPVSVSGAGSAIAALNGVANAAANASRTVTITTVYQTVGSPGSAFAVMHGGIPELATGGIVARMGEAGPERLHFAGGGTAWAPVDALYSVPPMTYVSPAPASRGAMETGGGGGDTYIFNNYGTVLGIDDVADSLEAAVTRRRRGYGQAVMA